MTGPFPHPKHAHACITPYSCRHVLQSHHTACAHLQSLLFASCSLHLAHTNSSPPVPATPPPRIPPFDSPNSFDCSPPRTARSRPPVPGGFPTGGRRRLPPCCPAAGSHAGRRSGSSRSPRRRCKHRTATCHRREPNGPRGPFNFCGPFSSCAPPLPHRRTAQRPQPHGSLAGQYGWYECRRYGRQYGRRSRLAGAAVRGVCSGQESAAVIVCCAGGGAGGAHCVQAGQEAASGRGR